MEVWVHLFGMPHDYRIFGTVMTIFMVTYIFLGLRLIDSFLRNVNKKFVFLGVAFLGTFLYIIDSAVIYGQSAVIISIVTLIPLSIYSFIKAFENSTW